MTRSALASAAFACAGGARGAPGAWAGQRVRPSGGTDNAGRAGRQGASCSLQARLDAHVELPQLGQEALRFWVSVRAKVPAGHVQSSSRAAKRALSWPWTALACTRFLKAATNLETSTKHQVKAIGRTGL